MKLAIISDIHEDIESLQKAIHLINKFQCEQVICLGDIVGCSAAVHPYHRLRDSSQCIEMVRNNCKTVVAGNHDLYAIRKIPFYKTNFQYTSDWYAMNFHKRKRLANGQVWLYEKHDLPLKLSSDHLDFLKRLPEFEILSFNNLNLFFSHYAYPDLSGSSTSFIHHNGQLADHLKFIKEKDCNLSFSGHRHVDGCLIGTSNSLTHYGFKSLKIDHDQYWIDGPSICRGSKPNGFMIFDTTNMELQLISLSSL